MIGEDAFVILALLDVGVGVGAGGSAGAGSGITGEAADALAFFGADALLDAGGGVGAGSAGAGEDSGEAADALAFFGTDEILDAGVGVVGVDVTAGAGAGVGVGVLFAARPRADDLGTTGRSSSTGDGMDGVFVAATLLEEKNKLVSSSRSNNTKDNEHKKRISRNDSIRI